MTTHCYLHGIKGLSLGPIEARQYEHSGEMYYQRELSLVDDKGGQSHITLFSETRKGLMLGGDEAVHLEPAPEPACAF